MQRMRGKSDVAEKYTAASYQRLTAGAYKAAIDQLSANSTKLRKDPVLLNKVHSNTKIVSDAANSVNNRPAE